MKFLFSLALLIFSASFAGAQASPKNPEVKIGVRTITITNKKKVVVSKRTEHVKITTKHASADYLARRQSMMVSSKTVAAPNSKTSAKAFATTVHPYYGGPSTTIVDAQSFGAANTGGPNVVKTFTYALPTGDTTLSFAMTAGTSFSIQTSSCTGSQCTAQIAFAPKNPGLLTDAVSVKDSSSNLIYQTFVSGNGLGPQFGFMFGEETDYSGFASYPTGTAWGPDGTFYVMDGSNGTVTRVKFGGAISSFQISNLCNPAGIAVDGAGTVYAADPTFNQVVAYSAAGVQTVVQTTPLLNPTWVAVDGTGALYISDTGNGRIIKLDNHNVESTVLSGLNAPAGLALDGTGNLYFADQNNSGEIKELVATTGQTASIASDLGSILSLSLDAAGDVYFTTSADFGIFDQATGNTFTQEYEGAPYSVAVAPNGDILTTNSNSGFFRVLDVSTGNFGLETQIQSTASGQLTIANTGNSALSLTALGVGGPAYRIDSSTICNTGSSLPPGNACVVTLDFTPPTINNNYQDTFTATSNSLNASGTQNTFALFGTGDGASTSTTLNINPQSATLGANITFTAAVTNNGSALPGPTGTVNFLDGDSQLGSANLNNGTAVFTTNSLSAGTHNVTAYYTGDSNNGTSSSYMSSVTVGIGTTGAGTSLSVSSTSINLNQPETLTVTVSGNGATPTGTVTFLDGGNTIGNGTLSGSGTSATSSITVSNLSGGSHGIYVNYSGDANYGTGTSNTQTVTVAQGASATTLSINPSSTNTEQTVTLTANVTSGTNPAESGLVIFSDQNGTIGYASIQSSDTGGSASYNTVLSAGSHQVIANFTQDTNYSDSISASQTVIVSQGTPYTNLNVSAANINPGQTEILTMQLGDGDAFGEPGTVTFSDQNGTLGTGTACACYTGGYSTLQLTNLSPGIHYITGTYGGDSNYSGTTSSPQTVTVSGASVLTTTTTLSVSANNITAGQTETLTATISGGNSPAQTGTVTFADQNGTIGSMTVTGTSSGSTASLALGTLSVGTHQITATYSGDSSYGSSVSAAQTVTVSSGTTNPTATTTTLAISSTSPALGSSVTFTATVGANGNSPSGTVTFADQNGTISTVNLVVGDSTGTATLTYSGLSFGTHQVTATYNGNTNYSASTSAAQTVNVGAATSTTALTVNPTTATAGQNVILAGSVQSYTSPALNGVISFADQNGSLGSATITPNSTGGAASITLSTLSVGAHQVTATYGSDSEHASSASPAQTVTITQGSAITTTTTLVVTTSVAYKSTVALRASVTSANAAVTGQVIFCDATAPRCVPEQRLAVAQIVSPGVASVMLPSGTIGNHTYIAKFLGTTAFAASSSAAQTVTVTGTYPSTTTIAATGTAGNYTLTGTVVGLGSRTLSPSGTVTFNDTTNTSNPALGNPALGSGTVGFTAVTASGSPNKTGAGSYGVASGDFNRDGFMDIAVENYYANTVSVLLGNGDGTFQAQVSYAVGSSPERILVADFNGDGIPDLVVANTGSSTVSILVGNGDGTFKTQVTYAAASPVGLGVMDLNHDGIADIVAGDYYANTMSVLLGNGDGTFKTAVTYATGGTPQTLAEGDFNGDGKVDIAVGNLAGNTVGIFLGNGDGTFQAQVTYPVGRAPQGVQVGDFNSDGFDDLAVSNSTDNTISILLGNGDGTFKPQVTYPVGADPVGLVIADFNGDGKQDLSVGNTAQSALTQSILLGNGDGTFQPQLTFPTGNFPYGEVAADFNGDGFPDLAISNFNDATATILLSQVTETAIATVSGVSIGSPTGAHNVNARYSGDSNYTTSTSSTIALTNSTRAASATNLTGTPSTQTALQYTPFLVAVAGTTQASPAATGTITLSNLNGTPAMPTTAFSLPGGNVNIYIPGLVTGVYSVVATYSGDSVYAPSVSAAVPLTITAATTATTLTPSAANIMVNQTETLTATIPSAPAATPPNGSTGASYGPIAPTGTITYSDQNGNLGTMTLTGASTSSSAALALSTLSAGVHQITAKYSGDRYYAASTSPAQTVMVTAASTGPVIDSKSFGSAVLAGAPATLTLTYTAPTGSTSVTATTAIGTAFKAQPATCANGVCSVPVSFTPTYPGLATDALTLRDANGNLLDKTFLYGTGNGPQLGYDLAYGVFNTFSGTVKSPASVVVGPDANLYVGDIATNQVFKVTAGTYSGGTPVTVQGLGKPGGIAVSGDSTVYIADQTNNVIRSLNTITSSQGTLTTTALSTPTGVTVDGTGAIYISDTGHGRIIKIDNQGVETTVATGLTTPGGIALDAAGDLFYADPTSGGEITEIPVGGGSSILIAKNLGTLGDIAVAPTGRVYFATTKSVSNILNGTVYSNGYFNLSGNPVNYGMALDRSQNIITTNTSGGVLAVTYRGGSSFTFGTPVGTTNTCCDSLENTGNSSLTVASVVNSGANYALHSGGGECVAGQVLQPAQTCGVAVDFSPTAFQNYQDTVTVTSNSLNVAGSTNTSSLLETGQQIPTTVTVAISPNPVRAGQAITFTATLAFTSTYATPPTGTMKFLNADGSTLASVPLTGLTTQYTTSLPAGSYSVTASYSGDTAFVTSTSAAQTYTVIALTPQTINFPAIPNHLASDAPFTLGAAASSGLTVFYTVTAGPATVSGNTVTLTGGAGTVTIQATQAGNTIYAAATPVSQSFNVTSSVATLSGVSPASGALGSMATTVTLTGASFTTGDVVQLNGATISSAYVNTTTLTAVIPASFFAQTGTGLITVFDPVSKVTTAPVTFTVSNAPQIVFTGPSTSTSGAQPALTFQLVNPYPVALSGALTLSFTPVASAGVNDPAVQFATGGRTLPFSIPANSTVTPTVLLQTGTVAGAATITLGVTANGVNVTPAGVAPVVITIPPAAPTITSTTVTRSGNTLTVAMVGFSNTRETTQAVFHFTPVSGATIANPDVTLTVTPTFATWFASTQSVTYGSEFTYTQTFTLDQDANIVQGVTVTLANTVGTSATATSP